MIWYTATQPLLFPFVHMVERFARCNHVVVLHEAQFTRDKMSQTISTANGPAKVAVTLSNAGRVPFKEVILLDPARWSQRVLRQMAITYGKQPGYRQHKDQFAEFMDCLAREQELSTASLGHRCIDWCRQLLGLEFRTHVSYDLVPVRPADPCRWMRSFAEPLDATDYIQGAASIRAYFVKGVFAPVRVWGQEFIVPQYRQLTGSFQPLVSVLDPLFLHGAQFVRELIRADKGPGAAAGTAVRMHDV